MPPSTPWEQFKFGLFFGLGFAIAGGVMPLIIWVISKSHIR